MKNKTLRVILDLLLVVSIFVFPWYFVVFLSLLLLMFFKPFEVVIVGVLMDALYGTELWGSEFVFTIMSLSALILIYFLKRNLLIYS